MATIGDELLRRAGGQSDYAADGALFVPKPRLDDIVVAAAAIRETEHRQAEAMRAGRKLREQLRFRENLARRASDVNYGFRQHLREISAAIEE